MKKESIDVYTFGLSANADSCRDWSAFHQHPDEVEIQFHSKGPVYMRFGGRIEKIDVHQTVLFWGAIPHQVVECPRDTQYYWVVIPLSLVIQMDLPDDFLLRILNGEMMYESEASLRRIDELSILGWKGVDLNKNPDLRQSFILWAHSRLIRFAYNFFRPQEADASPHWQDDRHTRHQLEYQKEKAAFRRMYDFITANYLKNICVGDAAKASGLYKTYANTLFTEQTGISIGRFINMLRTVRAQSLLLTSDMKILNVALESGFRSLSNFYKIFEKQVGETPSRYRMNRLPKRVE